MLNKPAPAMQPAIAAHLSESSCENEANKTIAAWHSGTFDRPLRRAREYIEIVRKTAAGERVEYQGEIYSTGQRFQLSWKPSHPTFPIYLAGLGPQMTRLVGQISDGVFINMATPATIREIASRVRAGAVEAGRDPKEVQIIAKVRVSLHSDRATANGRESTRSLLSRTPALQFAHTCGRATVHSRMI